MHNTPRGNRLHIALFGRRNAGKSSLINALTRQDLAIVSPVAGTTTDPVYKSMEIVPLGPVVVIDTAGLDDEGELGLLRVEKSLAVLAKTDLAVLVLDGGKEPGHWEEEVAKQCHARKIPLLLVINKSDLAESPAVKSGQLQQSLQAVGVVNVSALTGQGIGDLKVALVRYAPPHWDEQTLAGDLVSPGDTVVLVAPIDLAAPKGRLILPQVQVIRDLLDHDAMPYIVKEREMKECMASLAKRPRLVITDSQVFLKADADTPPDVLLTSFSILFARYKGSLEALVSGAKTLLELRPGDRVLISEGCSHHRVEDDIGSVKLPRWIRQHVGGEIEFEWSSGHTFPRDLSSYRLIVHCGACMLNRREMMARIMEAGQAGVPIVNYGVAIAALQGILPRALSPFPLLAEQFLAGEEC
ncbi:[FeFe] hydrogenase H-cluster maturation GTPase HydF [Azotosporobacter soli]|uniref:[FeFe] hydrogenase H-cluster maturation GTPase HydF n=1 Tax=Azotosporobacter soli TaxID=3055040 RepID=UPI0031FF1807